MADNKPNKRKHIRYVDPEAKPLRLRYRWAGQKELEFYALVADESYSGLGCIYIGNAACDIDDEIILIESKEIESICKVARCYRMDRNVYFLGITLLGL